MTIHASGSNFMSNAAILTWMETKTEGIYGHMREAMDVSDTRAGAEDALNEIKAKLGDIKTKNSTPEEVRGLINHARDEFKDVPEVEKALGAYAKELNGEAAKTSVEAQGIRWQIQALTGQLATTLDPRAKGPIQNQISGLQSKLDAKKVSISDEQIDQWTKDIGDVVQGLGKQDQLGLINIQEFNAQLNQAKQTASALMDAADKAASSIINHIA